MCISLTQSVHKLLEGIDEISFNFIAMKLSSTLRYSLNLHVSGDTVQWIDANEVVAANHIYVAYMQMFTLNKVE